MNSCENFLITLINWIPLHMIAESITTFLRGKIGKYRGISSWISGVNQRRTLGTQLSSFSRCGDSTVNYVGSLIASIDTSPLFVRQGCVYAVVVYGALIVLASKQISRFASPFSFAQSTHIIIKHYIQLRNVGSPRGLYAESNNGTGFSFV